MWFDVVKNQQLEIEGISRENVKGVKRSLGKMVDRVKNMRTYVQNNRTSPELGRNIDSILTNLQYDVETLLELLNVSENIQFEDQMRGKE